MNLVIIVLILVFGLADKVLALYRLLHRLRLQINSTTFNISAFVKVIRPHFLPAILPLIYSSERVLMTVKLLLAQRLLSLQQSVVTLLCIELG